MNRITKLRLAITGHTNTGKTSLMRTLAHNAEFGEVLDAPGTTRHVEGQQLSLPNHHTIELFDTPGLEDSSALLDYLEQIRENHRLRQQSRLEGIQALQRFLQSPDSRGRFEQEARVITKLLDCDAGLYVIDIRDPVLEKYRNELAILSSCSRPIIPVLNFMYSQENHLEDWRETLSHLGLHVVIEFDTVAPAIGAEELLYEKLALVMNHHHDILKQMSEFVTQQRKERHHQANIIIADALVDLTSWRDTCSPDEEAVSQCIHQMQQAVRHREHLLIKELLKHYKFRQEDYISEELPIEGERWETDLFNPQTMKDMGIHVGKGFAAGAATGAVIDVFTGGISLGAATLIGGVIGSIWQGVDKFGKRIGGLIQGYQELTIDNTVICLMALRGIQLRDALDRRGHAAMTPIQPVQESSYEIWQESRLPNPLDQARSQPQWCRLNKSFSHSTHREQLVKAVAKKLS